MDHPAVAVLHQVSRLAVDPARRDAVGAEEVGVHRRGLAVPPRRRQVRQLRGTEATARSHLEHSVCETTPSCALIMLPFDLVPSRLCGDECITLSLRSHCAFIKRGNEEESRSGSVVNTCAVEVIAGDSRNNTPRHSCSTSVFLLCCPLGTQRLKSFSCMLLGGINCEEKHVIDRLL